MIIKKIKAENKHRRPKDNFNYKRQSSVIYHFRKIREFVIIFIIRITITLKLFICKAGVINLAKRQPQELHRNCHFLETQMREFLILTSVPVISTESSNSSVNSPPPPPAQTSVAITIPWLNLQSCNTSKHWCPKSISVF